MSLEEESIKCSDCNRPLMHIRRYGTQNKITKIKAECPFCEGHSFIVSVVGQFGFGPIGQSEKYNATVINDIEQINDLWIFKIIKRI